MINKDNSLQICLCINSEDNENNKKSIQINKLKAIYQHFNQFLIKILMQFDETLLDPDFKFNIINYFDEIQNYTNEITIKSIQIDNSEDENIFQLNNLRNLYFSFLQDKVKQFSIILPIKLPTGGDNSIIWLDNIAKLIQYYLKNLDKKPCIRFNKDIRLKLIKQFEHNAYPSEDQKEKLAKSLDLTFNQINIWFANQRMRNHMFRNKRKAAILEVFQHLNIDQYPDFNSNLIEGNNHEIEDND